MHAHTHTHVHTYTHVNPHTHTHIHTHTHTHTLTSVVPDVRFEYGGDHLDETGWMDNIQLFDVLLIPAKKSRKGYER